VKVERSEGDKIRLVFVDELDGTEDDGARGEMRVLPNHTLQRTGPAMLALRPLSVAG